MEERKMEDQMPSKAAVNRYKVLWRVFLIANFGLGAYMFAQAGKKKRVKEKTETPVDVTSTLTTVTTHTDEEPIVAQPKTTPVIVRQPIPEDQQRELFKWMLGEKRRVKPNNREEKLRIDKEKAILKEFLRSKSIPSI
ncbi:hypothetical protein F511_17640 [Dorcoceras hygrometricum]|uniref:Uncharacterized protein n=1 Tax=Dorcoceras hygrometricum TaxID=472368 RepID=A0A2Z7AIG9_9LAMI|nr:hypothetical protein F511_17640 [Dorcoceras hygrometricum]